MTTTAWGVMHKDGSLCVALIRRTRKEAMQAHRDMFPHMTRMFKLLWFHLCKVVITYRSPTPKLTVRQRPEKGNDMTDNAKPAFVGGAA